MAQQPCSEEHVLLLRGLSSVHIMGQLTTAWNSTSRGPDTLFWLLKTPAHLNGSKTHTQAYTNTIK